VQPDDTVAIRTVKTGPAQGERISIQSGLTPGDRVVVDGTDRLRDGAKINIASTSQPAGGAQQKKSKKAATNP
jgi:multidrug efflux system membrane fusion protein